MPHCKREALGNSTHLQGCSKHSVAAIIGFVVTIIIKSSFSGGQGHAWLCVCVCPLAQPNAQHVLHMGRLEREVRASESCRWQEED